MYTLHSNWPLRWQAKKKRWQVTGQIIGGNLIIIIIVIIVIIIIFIFIIVIIIIYYYLSLSLAISYFHMVWQRIIAKFVRTDQYPPVVAVEPRSVGAGENEAEALSLVLIDWRPLEGVRETELWDSSQLVRLAVANLWSKQEASYHGNWHG